MEGVAAAAKVEMKKVEKEKEKVVMAMKVGKATKMASATILSTRCARSHTPYTALYRRTINARQRKGTTFPTSSPPRTT